MTRLTKEECNFSRWEVMYNSPTGSENYFVYSNAIQNLVNTSLIQLENLKAAAKVYANDAQLVFVTSPDISLAGSAEWQYVFKSVSQQEVLVYLKAKWINLSFRRNK